MRQRYTLPMLHSSHITGIGLWRGWGVHENPLPAFLSPAARRARLIELDDAGKPRRYITMVDVRHGPAVIPVWSIALPINHGEGVAFTESQNFRDHGEDSAPVASDKT